MFQGQFSLRIPIKHIVGKPNHDKFIIYILERAKIVKRNKPCIPFFCRFFSSNQIKNSPHTGLFLITLLMSTNEKNPAGFLKTKELVNLLKRNWF